MGLDAHPPPRAFCASSKEMDIFAFEAQKFLKARCARLGTWLALPLAAEHIMNAAGSARRRCK